MMRNTATELESTSTPITLFGIPFNIIQQMLESSSCPIYPTLILQNLVKEMLDEGLKETNINSLSGQNNVSTGRLPRPVKGYRALRADKVLSPGYSCPLENR